MAYLTKLIVAPMPDGRRWYLVQPLRWRGARSGREVEVRRYFVTDFASIPRPIWWFLSPWGKHGRAAVLHDALYWERTGARCDADAVFLEAMEEAGQLLVFRRLMWLAVRLFGWLAWHGNEVDRARGVNRYLADGEVPAADAVAPRRGLDRIFAVLCSRFCSNGGR